MSEIIFPYITRGAGCDVGFPIRKINNTDTLIFIVDIYDNITKISVNTKTYVIFPALNNIGLMAKITVHKK